VLDLPASVKMDNLTTLIKIGISNLDLVKYLVQQGTQSLAARIKTLQTFYPAAQAKDWRVIDAGIRVQAIKKTDGEAGIVHYGTEVITNADRTISALLGASPGASVSVNIVLEVVKMCLPHLIETPEGRARLQEMIPTWKEDLKLSGSADRFRTVRAQASAALQLAA
jgi:malate dehydrogenase (quinone)